MAVGEVGGRADAAGVTAVPIADQPVGPVLGRLFTLLVALTFAVLGVLTVVAFLLPTVSYTRIASETDSVINTAAMVSAAAVAAFALLRYRDSGGVDALLQASAFFVLFAASAMRTLIVTGGLGSYRGYEVATAGQAPLYASLFSQMLAGGLLAAGAVAVLRGWNKPTRRGAFVVLFVPTAITVVMTMVAFVREPQLAVLLAPETLRQLLRPDAVFETRLISLPHLLVWLTAAIVFGVAAYAYGRTWLAGRTGTYTALLAISLIVAAFGQVHYAIVPGTYSDLLTSGDFLRLSFYLLSLTAVGWAIQQDLGRLRNAYAELARLRQVDAHRISAETRAGLAREVHDGLVQELWLARLTSAQLGHLADMPADAKPMLGRLEVTLETAMFEARQALVTLQPQGGASFADLLRHFAEDYSDRFDIDIEIEIAPGRLPALATDIQSELLRICREALNNARKHADASLVRLRLETGDAVMRLSVSDNGAGFDVDAVGRAGFGLDSMRERAHKIGAQLTIRSAPMDGTSVTVELPLLDVASEGPR